MEALNVSWIHWAMLTRTIISQTEERRKYESIVFYQVLSQLPREKEVCCDMGMTLSSMLGEKDTTISKRFRKSELVGLNTAFHDHARLN